MTLTRRSVLSAIGATLPFGLSAKAATSPVGTPPVLCFYSFEEALRKAFEDRPSNDQVFPCRRLEVGHSEQIRTGVQGCHNDRPFAGFPTGHLRIVRTGSEPGPVCQGVRLYVSTVDILLTGGLTQSDPSHPLDFASLPPAPTFTQGHTERA